MSSIMVVEAVAQSICGGTPNADTANSAAVTNWRICDAAGKCLRIHRIFGSMRLEWVVVPVMR